MNQKVLLGEEKGLGGGAVGGTRNDNTGKITQVSLEAQERVGLGNLKTREMPKAKGIRLILTKHGPRNEGRVRPVRA